MIKEAVKQWNENKHMLKEYFSTTKQEDYCDYQTIVVKLFELVITELKDKDGYTIKFDISKMTVIDDDDQGTTTYIIPKRLLPTKCK